MEIKENEDTHIRSRPLPDDLWVPLRALGVTLGWLTLFVSALIIVVLEPGTARSSLASFIGVMLIGFLIDPFRPPPEYGGDLLREARQKRVMYYLTLIGTAAGLAALWQTILASVATGSEDRSALPSSLSPYLGGRIH